MFVFSPEEPATVTKRRRSPQPVGPHPSKVGRSACPGAGRIVMSFPLKKRQVTEAPS